MTAAIDITTEQRKTLLALLRRFIPGVEVWAYGSRVKWTARINSDLDLMAFATRAQHTAVSELKDALDESDLPFLVDLHIWDDVPERFHEIIRKEYVVIQKAEEKQAGWVMTGKWESSPLSELCEQIADCPHSTPLWTDGGVIVLRNQNIRDGRLDLSSPSYTDEAHFEQRSRRARLKAGDLVLTREAPMGEVCMIPENLRCCLGQRMVMLRPDPKKCDPRFLLYSIQSDTVQHEIKVNEGTGSTVSNLRIPLLEALPIPYPPLAEQKAIAAVLGALDDKIELNRRMNATLEAMAQALFQSWFVDFDPVRAKLDGRQPVGMDKATAALFPDQLEDSPLGHIPKGWRVTTIGETCQTIFSGGTPSTQEASYWGGDIPWLSSGETRSIFIIDTEKAITKAGVENSSTRVARAGCTVIAGAGQGHTRGQTSLLTFKSYINQSVVALASHPKVSSDLFLFFDLARRYEEFRQLSDSHSSRGSLTTKLLASMKCVLPPHELVIAFDKAAQSLASQITANLHQSRTLATLRDTLLPKLLSGELSVAALEPK